MTASCVVAIDQGTTNTRVLVADDHGRVIASAARELPLLCPRPGWVEHDPERIWADTRSLIGESLSESGRSVLDVARIGNANQRETVVLWERSTGRPVSNAIVWQDRRTTPMCQRLIADGAGEWVRERTGLVLDPYFSASKIAWLLDSDAELRRRADQGDLCAGTIESFLIFRLTGGVHVTEPTNASRTMLMDLETFDWDEDLLALFDVPRILLPEIHPSAGVFGETSTGLDLGRHVPVAGALGDQQSALFAQACFGPGLAKNTYGTGSFLLENTGTERLRAGDLLDTVAFSAPGGPASYALEGSIFATGSAVQWLRDGLGIINSAEETAGLAASVTDNDDVWFVPALGGLGAPYWDPEARGTLLGVTRGTTRAHVVRAVLESIAYQTLDVTDAMEAAGRPVTELRVDGGACVNDWLMQFQSDLLGMPVDVAATLETTGVGAAFCAGLATGLWRDQADVARLRASGRRYEPHQGRVDRHRGHARWKEAVERARHWAVAPG
ncbi:MAG: glycerol kinase GlpK [Candidatus Limnocylindrales bacterium]